MPGASFEDVYLVNPAHARPSTPDEVAGLQSELGVAMPAGYGEYVLRLGGGALGHWVRVYAPTDLATRTREWRERVQEYWFWDTSAAGIEPRVFQQQGVVLADTFDGDELCFVPEDPRGAVLAATRRRRGRVPRTGTAVRPGRAGGRRREPVGGGLDL